MLQNVTVGKNPTAGGTDPTVGLIPPWDQMLQNVTLGKNPTAGGTDPTVGLIPPWDQMLQNVPVGKNPVVHADPPHPPVPRLACGRAAPATTANSISWRVRRNSRIRRHQLGAAVLSYHSPASNLPASSISDRYTGPERFPTSPTQRPAYPSALPARVAVRSESPHPAERTNKKAAGSHGPGGLGDCLPLPPRRQVSSPAPPPSPSTSPRKRSCPHPHARTANPPQHIFLFSRHFPNPP
jgi:hypothetical protein